MSNWSPKAASALRPRPSGRLSAHEVRRRMLDQGHQVIRERGLTVGLALTGGNVDAPVFSRVLAQN